MSRHIELLYPVAILKIATLKGYFREMYLLSAHIRGATIVDRNGRHIETGLIAS